MIHATIPGVLLDDARYLPSDNSGGFSRQQQVRFALSTSKGRGIGTERFLVVQCSVRGAYANDIQHHLVAGKRVIACGELVLLGGAEPFMLLNVRSVEFIGGTFTGGAVRGESEA
jgi:hypothetical protein